MYYICRDYLGSVTAVTDETGNLIEENSQDFNRYVYAGNNPLVYTDQKGKLFFISYLVGFLKGLFSGKNPIATGLKAVSNEAKIVGGLFAVNQYNNFGKQAWELASRFT